MAKYRTRSPQEKDLDTFLRHYPSMGPEVERLLALQLPASFGPISEAPDTPESKAAREQLTFYNIKEENGDA